MEAAASFPDRLFEAAGKRYCACEGVRGRSSDVGRQEWRFVGSGVSGRGSLPDAGDGVAQLGTPAEAADRHVEPRSRGVLRTVGRVRSARSGAQDATSTLSGLGSAIAVSSNVGAFSQKRQRRMTYDAVGCVVNT